MKITNHAKKRIQQRGFSDIVIEIIEKNGRISSAPGGVEKVFFGNKEYNKLLYEFKTVIKLIERAKGGTLIVAKDKMVTVYKTQHT